MFQTKKDDVKGKNGSQKFAKLMVHPVNQDFSFTYFRS